MKKRATIAAVSTLGIAGLGLGIAGVATADPSATPTPSNSASTSGTATPDKNAPGKGGPGTAEQGGGTSDGHRGGHRGGPGIAGTSTAELAKALGIDEAKVATAVEQTRQTLRQKEAPKDKGSSTAAERDQQRAAMKKQFAATLAGKLGVSEQKVTAAMATVEQNRQTQRTAELTTKLSAAVKAGTLTQSEADAVLKAAKGGVIDVRVR